MLLPGFVESKKMIQTKTIAMVLLLIIATVGAIGIQSAYACLSPINTMG
jgi:hypothetical protein